MKALFHTFTFLLLWAAAPATLPATGVECGLASQPHNSCHAGCAAAYLNGLQMATPAASSLARAHSDNLPSFAAAKPHLGAPSAAEGIEAPDDTPTDNIWVQTPQALFRLLGAQDVQIRLGPDNAAANQRLFLSQRKLRL